MCLILTVKDEIMGNNENEMLHGLSTFGYGSPYAIFNFLPLLNQND